MTDQSSGRGSTIPTFILPFQNSNSIRVQPKQDQEKSRSQVPFTISRLAVNPVIATQTNQKSNESINNRSVVSSSPTPTSSPVIIQQHSTSTQQQNNTSNQQSTFIYTPLKDETSVSIQKPTTTTLTPLLVAETTKKTTTTEAKRNDENSLSVSEKLIEESTKQVTYWKNAYESEKSALILAKQKLNNIIQQTQKNIEEERENFEIKFREYKKFIANEAAKEIDTIAEEKEKEKNDFIKSILIKLLSNVAPPKEGSKNSYEYMSIEDLSQILTHTVSLISNTNPNVNNLSIFVHKDQENSKLTEKENEIEIKKLTQQLSDIQESFSLTQNDLSQSRNEIKKLKQINEEFQNQINELQIQLKEKQTNIQEYKNQIDKLKIKLSKEKLNENNNNNNNNNLLGNLDGYEEESNLNFISREIEMEREIQKLRSENDSLKKVAQILENENENNKNNNNEKNNNNNNEQQILSFRIKLLTQLIKNRTKNNENNENNNQRLRDQMTETENLLIEKSKINEENKSEIDLNFEISEVSSIELIQIGRYLTENFEENITKNLFFELCDEIDYYITFKIEEIETEKNEINSKLEKNEKEREFLEVTVLSLNESLEQSQAKLEKATEELQVLSKSHEENILNEERILEQQSRISELEEQFAGLERYACEAQEQVKILSEEKEELVERMSEFDKGKNFEKEINNLKIELENEKKKNEKFEDEIENYTQRIVDHLTNGENQFGLADDHFHRSIALIDNLTKFYSSTKQDLVDTKTQIEEFIAESY